MTLFQDWRALVWRELWIVPPWPVWKAAVLPGVAAGTLGIGVALGATTLAPNADPLTLIFGFLGMALGSGAYALYDWWRRWANHQIARVNGDLFVLSQDLATVVREPISIQKFCSGVQRVLETRCETFERAGRIEYCLICLLTLCIGTGPWRWPELLAEPLFDHGNKE